MSRSAHLPEPAGRSDKALEAKRRTRQKIRRMYLEAHCRGEQLHGKSLSSQQLVAIKREIRAKFLRIKIARVVIICATIVIVIGGLLTAFHLLCNLFLELHPSILHKWGHP